MLSLHGLGLIIGIIINCFWLTVISWCVRSANFQNKLQRCWFIGNLLCPQLNQNYANDPNLLVTIYYKFK